jgi:DNA-binding transcriptional LysR family regulator
MTFKQLEALYWIARLGGFAQAASRLHASQSAISKRIRELEQGFSVELFDRSSRSARLTEKGEKMFLLAERLLEHRDAAVEQFGGPEVMQRRLRIGVTELTAMTWLPRLIIAIQHAYPKIVIEPTVEDTALLKDKLLNDQLDLILVPDAFAEPRLASTPLGQVESVWMCRPGYVRQRSAMPLHELARHRLLVQGDSSGTGRIYGAWMKAQGVVPEDVIGVSNLMAVLGLTVSGLGIGYLPRECLQPMVHAKALRVVKVMPALPTISYVALRRDEGRSRSLTTIIELAQGCCDFSRMFQAHAG